MGKEDGLADRELAAARLEAYKARIRMNAAAQVVGHLKVEREIAREALEEIRGLPLAVDNSTIGMTDKDLLEKVAGIAGKALGEMGAVVKAEG